MNSSKADEIRSLANEILRHKKLYYAGRPEISDAAFDSLEDKLRTLAPHHPVLKMVGGELSASLPKVRHHTPMLSLAKTYQISELISWAQQRELVATYKVDGSSLSLQYKNGQLVLAKTRGNGKIGEDVTPKIQWVSDCVSTLKTKSNLDIRGELYCSEDQFGHLITEMQELGLESPTSPRNIVAGVLGRKQHIELARYFNFFAFDALSLEGEELFASETQKLEWLAEQGFGLPEWALVKTEKDIEAFLQKTKLFMNEGKIGIDGAVFTYNDCKLHAQAGATSHHPRFKMSFKWQGTTAITKIKDITWSTSRLGMVTPVAVVDSVQLSGAIINNVTLHNAAYVHSFDLKAGDQIEIVRSGEVIPKFLQVVTKAKGSHIMPEICPSCGHKLFFDDVRLVCKNHQGCPAQQVGTILNWIRCVGIDDLSEKRLWPLIEMGLVAHMSDLYKLSVEDFLKLPLTKEKMAHKLYNNIQTTKKLPLAQFLNGLGIAHAGLTTWETLVGEFKSLECLRKVTVDDLLALRGFATTLATQIVEGLACKSYDIEKLLAVGVRPFTPSQKQSHSPLSEKIFVLTGTMRHPRNKITERIKALGGKVSDSVSKQTFALITSDPQSKSTKTQKAHKLGVSIMGEDELYKLLEIKSE